ncbi:MAG: stringent starvation protein A [Gammaproteobacteria bacterium RIFCSPLOWO2_02_FULL_56_15]|nr:MAG: stringent starvation protein A [Gammaproteobacteria bacterium RIFCSPLOWO2_02_FULL_56_15]
MVSIANKRSVMVLYSDTVNPVGHSVRIVLAEKDINVDIRYIQGNELPEDLAELNPYNTVLTLIDRDLVLYDEQIIMEYLDERFPHPPLLPVDPVSRANNRQLRFRVMRDLYRQVEQLTAEDEIAAANARKEIRDNLTAIAPIFSQKPFFMSDEYSLVDCCLAPLLWRLDHYGIKLPLSAKVINEYARRMFDRDAFKLSLSLWEKEIRL